ncbi:membrane-associated zinc metalloprotease [Caldalkalibacillus thermarum TA2.A1]|uniref:Zinc metalloprotease n=1 Tax=Caldalkalibacillus thermarum (strain TA2.A1) TaxID=986075 RepID=F5L4K5_CALTT|nr:RIP metalloprotease RseP [Caldalkalibacillus thermarum]EGL83722.1 membrane-associated zinc metalloprotease [Caldalkalibacillus thermarum TA2.A1]
MQTVISIILVIGVIIFVHELGHLIVAKRAGILCREFAIGFGPKLFSFRKGETLYTIRLLPLGGYVRMAGEDPEMVQIKTGHDVGLQFNAEGKVTKIILNRKKKLSHTETLNVQRIDLEHDLFIEGYNAEEELVRYEVDREAVLVYDNQEMLIAPYDRQFGSKTLGQRAATIFAGPLANFILAFVLFTGLALSFGVPSEEPIIGDVLPGSVAEEAGLEQGDRILAINQKAMDSWDELVRTIMHNPGRELVFVVERNNEEFELTITPAVREHELESGEQIGFIGVHQHVEHSVLGAFVYGFNYMVELSTLIFKVIGMLFTGAVGLDALAGPVGIFDFTGQAAQAGLPILLRWTAALSVNLAILNLLPIPALDGGRLLFLALEAVRGRPIDPQKEGLAHFIGFALLMLLILVVTWNDIQRVFFN